MTSPVCPSWTTTSELFMKISISPSGDDSKRFISFTEAEKASLIRHYKAIGIAADQLGIRPKFLYELADRFNSENSTCHLPGDILKYIVNERKNGNWVKLGRGTQIPRANLKFNLVELITLKAIYLKIGITLDNYLFYPQLAERMSVGFEVLTGRRIDRGDLVEFAMFERKQKRWISLDINPAPFEAVADLGKLDELDEFNQEDAS